MSASLAPGGCTTDAAEVSDDSSERDTNAGGGTSTEFSQKREELCAATFGNTDSFELCTEDAASCTFSAGLGGSRSCADVCEAAGSECLQAFGNATSNPCKVGPEIDCDTAGHVDDICVCALDHSDGESVNPSSTGGNPSPLSFDTTEMPRSLGKELVFHSGFEHGVDLPRPQVEGRQWWQEFRGRDEATGFSWDDDLPGSPRFQFLVLSDKNISNHADNRIETVAGFDGSQTRALYMEQLLDDRDMDYNSRNQLLFGNDGGFANDVYYSYWIKLQGDLNELPQKCNSTASWRLMGEWFTANDRIGYEIRDVGKTPAWHLKHERRASGGGWENGLFGDTNRDVAVPVGEWFFLEVYLKHSTGGDGRVWIRVNGETVFDQRGRNRTGGQVSDMFTPKLYDGYRNACRRFQWVDEFQIWR